MTSRVDVPEGVGAAALVATHPPADEQPAAHDAGGVVSEGGGHGSRLLPAVAAGIVTLGRVGDAPASRFPA